MKYYNPLLDSYPEFESTKFDVPLYQDIGVFLNTSFVPGTTFQFAWDSVSMGNLRRCPRKYWFEHVQGYRLDPMPIALHFGIAYHTCMEIWHKLLTSGMNPELAHLRIIKLAGLLGEFFISTDTARTKETLVRAVSWYIDAHSPDNAQTVLLKNGEPATELSFQIPIAEVNGIEILLCGHIDRVADLMGEVYPTDYKTTKLALGQGFMDQFKPNVQTAGYVTAGWILAHEGGLFPKPPAGMLIDGIQLGVNFARFQRFTIPFYEEEIQQFIDDYEAWVHFALRCSELNRWPANEHSCTSYGGCPFLSVCKSHPGKQARMLEQHYVKSTWDPRRAR
jgi:hypothetical protein